MKSITRIGEGGTVPDFTRGNWEWERARRLTRVATRRYMVKKLNRYKGGTGQ